jgi:hypothetical protein
MEGIDDVIEPEPDGGIRQLVTAQFSSIRLPARIQEPAALKCPLPVGILQVLAERLGERNGQFLQANQLAAGGTYFQKRLPESELLGRDVPAEDDDPTPVVLEGRPGMDEGLCQG